jgi:ABC-type sugar transport system ATPase subunit
MTTLDASPDAGPPGSLGRAPLVRVDGVRRHFGQVEALAGLSFEVPENSITVLLGPNGAGKTTAIRMITGALKPDSGSVRVFGLDPEVDGEEVRRRCGVVSAKPALYDRLSGYDNLAYSAELYGLGRGAAGTERIRAAVRNTGAVLPEHPAHIVRCILDSLAAGYARTIADAERLADVRAGVVHIVGGGSQNRLLCQLTADATGKRVIAGPVEATALGNVLVQARAAGVLNGGLGELRAVVRASQHPAEYMPSARAAHQSVVPSGGAQ